MKLTVALGEVMGHRVWNAMAEPIEIPIGVSGGGFGPLRIPVRLIAVVHVQLPIVHLSKCNMCSWMQYTAMLLQRHSWMTKDKSAMPYMRTMTSSSLLLGAIVCTCSNVLYLLRQVVLPSYLMELLCCMVAEYRGKDQEIASHGPR